MFLTCHHHFAFPTPPKFHVYYYLFIYCDHHHHHFAFPTPPKFHVTLLLVIFMTCDGKEADVDYYEYCNLFIYHHHSHHFASPPTPKFHITSGTCNVHEMWWKRSWGGWKVSVGTIHMVIGQVEDANHPWFFTLIINFSACWAF